MEELTFSQEESDALAEIFNICFGAAANKLSSKFSRQVKLAKPKIAKSSGVTADGCVFMMKYTGDYSGDCFFALDAAAVEATGDFLNGSPEPAQRIPRVAELISLIAQTVAVAYEGAASGKLAFADSAVPVATVSELPQAPEMLSAGFQFKIEGIVDSALAVYFPAEFCRDIAADFLRAISGQMDGFDASKVQPEKDSGGEKGRLDALLRRAAGLEDVRAQVTVRLARKNVVFRDLWAVNEGGVIGFDKNARELLEVSLGGRVFARGDAVVSREKFAIKITEVRHERA